VAGPLVVTCTVMVTLALAPAASGLVRVKVTVPPLSLHDPTNDPRLQL